MTFFGAYHHLKLYILFYGDGLAIWHGFPDITHIYVNKSRKSTIFNLIELKFFKGYHDIPPNTAHFVL